MDPIHSNGDEYQNYWETRIFLQDEELFNSNWAIDEALSGCHDSNSLDGAASSAASKNIVSVRNQRKKLNDHLFALRSVVPKISKADEDEKDDLRMKLETAIAAVNDSQSPISV